MSDVMRVVWLCFACVMLVQCGPAAMRSGNLGGPTQEHREAAIASEATGDFYYGRRYFVEKTRFWGYVRKPRQPWNRGKLVMMREDQKQVPDRLPEDGAGGGLMRLIRILSIGCAGISRGRRLMIRTATNF